MSQLPIHWKKENVKKTNRLQPDGFNKGKRQKLRKQTTRIGVWSIQGLSKKVGKVIKEFEVKNSDFLLLLHTLFLFRLYYYVFIPQSRD